MERLNVVGKGVGICKKRDEMQEKCGCEKIRKKLNNGE